MNTMCRLGWGYSHGFPPAGSVCFFLAPLLVVIWFGIFYAFVVVKSRGPYLMDKLPSGGFVDVSELEWMLRYCAARW